MRSDLITGCCRMRLAGIPVDVGLRYTDTEKYLRKYVVHGSGPNENGPACVSEQAFIDWGRGGNEAGPFAEFCLLCQPVSEALMLSDGCIFHAAALRYGNAAVLLAGGSGAGKSTHCKMLIDGNPGEFSVINGDKPVLRCTDRGTEVHPSPWNGKEGMHGAGPAVLRGIFFVSRGQADSIRRAADVESAVLGFRMVFQSFADEAAIRRSAAMTEKIIRQAPCYIFSSSDIKGSSTLLYNFIREEIDGL